MYIFRPLTKSFDVDDSRPVIVSHEYIQLIEDTILEYIHKTVCNHKLYKLIQNKRHEFAFYNEELNIIRALKLSGFYFKVKSSSTCLRNSSNHQTQSALTFPMDFSLMTILRKYALNKSNNK